MTTQTAIREPDLTQSFEASLLMRSERQTWSAGESLFREGERPTGIYILHSGTVDLVFSARNGNVVRPLRTEQAGQILALSVVVSQLQRHDYSAVAHTDCTVGFIAADDFLVMLNESPVIWFSVLRLLSLDVNNCYESLRLGSLGG